MGEKEAKILLVDDDPDFVSATKIVLESKYQVIVASEGEEGIQKARDEKPDLIILDVLLPKIDGYHVCRMLKYNEQFKSIPVILLTAKAQPEDKKIGEEVKADAYIVKPFQSQELLREISRLINQ